MHGFFSSDGAPIAFLNKTGQLIILSVLWLLCCIPVITAGASTAALFYAVTKSVRRGRGYPSREFFRAFRIHLAKGAVVTALLLLFYGLSAYLFFGMAADRTDTLAGYFGPVLISVLLVTAVAVYIFPVMSRFAQGIGATFRQAAHMSVRCFYFTILLEAGLLLLIWAQCFVLPLPCILFTPGAGMYVFSFPLEKAMRPYYPSEVPEGADAWWME
ncbi:MAG: YesL family protein [Lachnospiraceae bacterium]|nr:YesL family protein [Lachnospiraceae bacterium]